MRILFGVCVLGIAALWGWALFWDKPIEPLPERFVGEFVMDRDRYVPPPEGDQGNPYPPGQSRHFYFGADGTYKMRIMVNAGNEMWREEGRVEMRDGLLVLERISVNRSEEPDVPTRYETIWGQDKEGEFLRLREVDQKYELFFRPAK